MACNRLLAILLYYLLAVVLLIIVCCVGWLCPGCYIASYVQKVIPYAYGRIFCTIRVWSYHMHIFIYVVAMYRTRMV